MMSNCYPCYNARIKPALAIFGLGNPGKPYVGTRHNLGFLALDVLSKHFGEGEWEDRQKFLAMTQEARVGIAPVLLVKPQTYMNLSGDSVRKVVEFFKLDPERQILVISDDIDLPLGEIRFLMKGGPGTHNGLKSVTDIFGEEFPRVRIGLGPNPATSDLSNWVLSRLAEDEKAAIDKALRGLPEAVTTFVMEGVPDSSNH